MCQLAFRSSIFVLLPRMTPELISTEGFGLFGHLGRMFKRARGVGWGKWEKHKAHKAVVSRSSHSSSFLPIPVVDLLRPCAVDC